VTDYIESLDVGIPFAPLTGQMMFQQGLNLLSGENGTFKTKLLQQLRSATGVTWRDEPGTQPTHRVQAISPRRNAQRREVEQVLNEVRQNDTKLAAMLSARNMDDRSFETYPSFGDLFYVVYNDLCRDGLSRIDHMNTATVMFNKVISSIFENYSLDAKWDDTIGSPRISLIKHGTVQVPLHGLSLGEQEVLSLATNLYCARDSFDVFLVDEPEVHLNWHLEEKLFDFLLDFCTSNGKQMIVVTHSRVVFTPRFLQLTSFLRWTDGRVEWGSELGPEQRRRLAGDAIDIIKLGAFSKPTFFVEDGAQALALEELARVFGADILVHECGTKSNVRSLFRVAIAEQWPSCYFLEDGDNEGAPGSPYNATNFVHLDRYCIECYLLDSRIAPTALGKSLEEFRGILFEAIRTMREAVLQKNKFFDFLFDQLRVEDITNENLSKFDVSLVADTVAGLTGFNRREMFRRVVRAGSDNGQLESVFPARLIDPIKNAVPVAT
jgi:hypothetical protein